MSQLKITGTLAEKYDTQNISDRFKKREFVLQISEDINGNIYSNYVKMQLTNNRCDIINTVNIGDTISVSFNFKGNRWERDGKVNYVTAIDAWNIEKH